MTMITRRAALRGIAAASTVVVTTPALQAVEASETPQERIRRQFRALSEALDAATPDLHGWVFNAFSRRAPFAASLQATAFHTLGVRYELEKTIFASGRTMEIPTERHHDIGFGRKW